MFLLTDVSQIKNKERRFVITSEDLAIINPNTHTSPIFMTRTDANLTMKIYKKIPILIDEKNNSNPWKIFIRSMFNMATDSPVFLTNHQLNSYPLYEAKMIFHFDHRFATYENATQANINEGNLPQCSPEMHSNPYFQSMPRYWVTMNSLTQKITNNDFSNWFFVLRRIAASGNERTLIASIIPKAGVGDSLTYLLLDTENNRFNCCLYCCLYSNINSLILDYITRLKSGGPNVSHFIIKQLPVQVPDNYTSIEINLIVSHVLELTYTAWDIKAFADDVWRDSDDSMKALLRQQWEENKAAIGGHTWAPPEWAEIKPDGIPFPPFKWDDDRRAVLRAELDALYARLYGLTRDELRYILDPADVYGPDFPGETFRVLKEKEIKKHGEYRTGRLVLEAWDRMEENAR